MSKDSKSVESLAQRRMAENEVVFRSYNEKIEESFKEIKKISEEAGATDYPVEDDIKDMMLHFYCECYDETCELRIIMKPALYKTLHRQRDQFMIVPGHNAVDIEKIIKKDETYWIVDKKFPLNQSKKKMQKTTRKV